jgi:hypothetical protein
MRCSPPSPSTSTGAAGFPRTSIDTFTVQVTSRQPRIMSRCLYARRLRPITGLTAASCWQNANRSTRRPRGEPLVVARHRSTLDGTAELQYGHNQAALKRCRHVWEGVARWLRLLRTGSRGSNRVLKRGWDAATVVPISWRPNYRGIRRSHGRDGRHGAGSARVIHERRTHLPRRLTVLQRRRIGARGVPRPGP